MAHHPFVLEDALYCQENHQQDNNIYYIPDHINPSPLLSLDQDEDLTTLFSKEHHYHHLCNNNNNLDNTNPYLGLFRREAVDWMLNAVAHYSFSTHTAVLAVNYFDRFIFSFKLQTDQKPWMPHLAAVSCLSLAAKVEEIHVPLLLDLQVEETKYVFEAKTIQRMEMLVLSTLEWKMNPVTPLSFIHYIIRRLGFNSEFLNRCECLLLSVIADCRFMCYLPSVIAAVTMLYVITSIKPCIGVEYKAQILAILGIDQDRVEDCCKLVRELTSVGFGAQSKKRKFGPGSPKGVMDLCFSSDSSNDSCDVAASVSSSPEPMSKKSRPIENIPR